MISRYFSFCYHVRKPRVLTENDLSLIRYRKSLKTARRNILIEALDHQNQYENIFLQRHKQEMLDKHRSNETTYRTQIIMNGFRLMRDIEKWKTRDEAKRLRLQGHIHQQNLRSMNKDRMLKILNYESDHFWYNPQNIQKRLLQETILPQFVGSTEHYQHLTEQALMYENMDFQGLQRIQNDEMTMRFKNKLLIPIYNEVVKLIKKVKSNQFKDNQVQYLTKVERINILYRMPELQSEKQADLAKAKKDYETKRAELLKKMEKPQNRQAFIKEKIVQIRSLLFYWKKYASILNMGSVEVDLMRQKSQVDKRLSKIASVIAQKEVKLKKQTMRENVYAHAQQENTEEEDEIDMRQFLQKEEEQTTPNDRIKVSNSDMQRLDQLLQYSGGSEGSQTQMKQQEYKDEGDRKFDQKQSIDLFHQLNLSQNEPIQFDQSQRFKQNSSVLIQGWKKLTKDPQLKRLLDEVGEIHVEQSALFWKIFSMH